jgi:hypothetical protein
MVAADYRLKMFSMGRGSTVVQGVGHAVDDGAANAARFWFEPMYEPISVSEDGNAFELKGQRLQVKAGQQVFQTTEISPKAKKFAETFTKKIPELVKVEPALADLQNIADIAVVAALVRQDRLDARIGWDASWCLDAKACPVPTVPVMKNAQTVVAIQGNAIACGGVAFSMHNVVGKDSRKTVKEGVLAAVPAAPKESTWQSQWVLPAVAVEAGANGSKGAKP